jgi:hypothetical protein
VLRRGLEDEWMEELSAGLRVVNEEVDG